MRERWQANKSAHFDGAVNNGKRCIASQVNDDYNGFGVGGVWQGLLD